MTRPPLVLATAVLGLTALAAPALACDCDAHRKEAAATAPSADVAPAPVAGEQAPPQTAGAPVDPADVR